MHNDRVIELSQQAIDKLVRQVQSGHSEALDTFLRTMSKFHRYSWHNCLLIFLQKPEATKVAGFRKWLEFGRHVNQGEKGILILAPITKYTPRKLRADPNATDEEQRKQMQEAQGFTSAYVFDISQTSGSPLPQLSRVQGHPAHYLNKLQILAKLEGIDLQYVTSLGGAEGVSRGGQIRVLESLPLAQRFSVVTHELCHELMHQRHREIKLSKQVKEVEAESVAFVVCEAVGLETGTASADYIGLYGGDADQILKSMARIKEVSTRILRALLA